jgi:hypothetical protein
MSQIYAKHKLKYIYLLGLCWRHFKGGSNLSFRLKTHASTRTQNFHLYPNHDDWKVKSGIRTMLNPNQYITNRQEIYNLFTKIIFSWD